MAIRHRYIITEYDGYVWVSRGYYTYNELLDTAGKVASATLVNELSGALYGFPERGRDEQTSAANSSRGPYIPTGQLGEK